MKKTIAILIVALLAATVLLGSVGCGKSKEELEEEARSFLRNAETFAPTEAESKRVATQIDGTLEKIASNTITAEELQASIASLELDSNNLRSQAQKSKSEYDKVLQLQDVENYKDYASTRVSVIDNSVDVIEKSVNYFKEVAGDLQAGKGIDPQKLSDYSDEMMTLLERGQELNQRAQDLMDENGLL